MSKTILYVGFYALPDKDAAANRVMNNAKALREAGNTVIFIDEQINSGFDSIEESLHNIDGFDVWTLKRPRNTKEYLQKMVSIREIEKVVHKYKIIDLIIAYNYPAIALRKLLHFCKIQNIKLASDCTEWYSGKEYSFPKNILCMIDSCLRMNYVQKKIDGIICISSFLEKYYNSKTLTVNVPPLIDIKEKIWSQEKYTYDINKINLVYAGTPGRCKDLVKPIIDAVNNSKSNDSIVLRIVGVTKEQYLESSGDIEDNIEKENICFLGRVSHSENVKIVKSSDFLIFIREKNRVSMAGFSTKFVEAVTCGTAVITTDTGNLKEYIDKYGLGYIINGQDDLTAILNLPYEELKKMSEKFVEIDNLFDIGNYLDILNQWVESVIEKN